MSDALRCPFCDRDVEGLTLYSLAGVFALLVCPTCYALLVSKAHQPYSKSTQRLRRLLGLRRRTTRREVVTHARILARQPVAGHSRAAAAHRPVESGVGRSALAIVGGTATEVRHASAIR